MNKAEYKILDGVFHSRSDRITLSEKYEDYRKAACVKLDIAKLRQRQMESELISAGWTPPQQAEPTENFVRDGMVGDEVWHPCFGNGEIDSIYPEHDNLWVKFQAGRVAFNSLGKRQASKQYYAALCWGHRIAQQINQGKPPVREDSDAKMKEL